jgi:hypothetical protein
MKPRLTYPGLASVLGATLALVVVICLGWLWLPRVIDTQIQIRTQTPSPALRIGTVDVAGLYQAKEAEVTAALLRQDATPAQRALALQAAADFGHRLGLGLQRLPAECDCLVLHQGALVGVGPGMTLIDLTPVLRASLAANDQEVTSQPGNTLSKDER